MHGRHDENGKALHTPFFMKYTCVDHIIKK